MTSFNNKVISQLLITLEKYIKGEIDEIGVEMNFAGNISVIEGSILYKRVKELCDLIEITLWKDDDKSKTEELLILIDELKNLLE